MSFSVAHRAQKIYSTVLEIFDYKKSSDVVTPYGLVKQQVAGIPSDAKVCVPGAGIGTYVVALIEQGVKPENIYAVELDESYYELGSAMMKRFNVNYIHTDFLDWDPNMNFDVIIGNPPYNNAGKIKGGRQTSGSSLWLQFLKKIPPLLKEGGFCSLVLPAAVGNTNSQGWKSLKNCRVISLETGVGGKFFRVGTEISVIVFEKAPPASAHTINGVLVDRSKVPILPANCDPISISVFTKICGFDPFVEWHRDNWPFFEKKAVKEEVVGMSFLDRAKVYNVQTFEELDSRPLKKVNICWTHTRSPKSVINLMRSKLFSFYARETMLSGNLSVGMVRALTAPEGWENLGSDIEIYEAYGLTSEEIARVEKTCGS